MDIKKTMIIALSLALAGCATSKPAAEAERTASGPATSSLSDSSVDISYVLGHSHRRFVAWAKNDGFGGQTLLDHQILRESAIERAHYTEFLAKVEQYVNAPHRRPADQGSAGQQSADLPTNEACRTPFTLTLRLGGDSKVLQGCRGEDDGGLSHLIRDGEFLLYSN